jgi:hypothetical protein
MAGEAKRVIVRAAAAALAALALLPAAYADQVSDQIGEALAAYQKQNLTTALAALDTAASLIRQKKAEAWKAALPQALPGWTAEAAEANSLAPMLLGGGTTVSRKYRKEGATVTVSIIADSPLVQGIAAFLASGVGGLVSDIRISVINGRRFVYTKADNSYQTLVADRVLVKVEGSHETDDAALNRYIDAIKYADIKRLAE